MRGYIAIGRASVTRGVECALSSTRWWNISTVALSKTRPRAWGPHVSGYLRVGWIICCCGLGRVFTGGTITREGFDSSSAMVIHATATTRRKVRLCDANNTCCSDGRATRPRRRQVVAGGCAGWATRVIEPNGAVEPAVEIETNTENKEANGNTAIEIQRPRCVCRAPQTSDVEDIGRVSNTVLVRLPSTGRVLN